MEFVDYRRVTIDTSIVVDKSRGEKLTAKMNVTFPRVPCYRECYFCIRDRPPLRIRYPSPRPRVNRENKISDTELVPQF